MKSIRIQNRLVLVEVQESGKEINFYYFRWFNGAWETDKLDGKIRPHNVVHLNKALGWFRLYIFDYNTAHMIYAD